MAKLFALEELDENIEVTEMEAPAEVGEIADVQTEVEPEVADVAEQTEAIDEGMDAADQMEQVEDVVEQAAEGEGLDPVAADAVKVAVEAICARIGANPKAVYSLYATENFQSASSRKANTKIALEGIGEFLKDMWKKLKAALIKLWQKAKAFFDKHFSSLARVKKALESMKAKVSASSGKISEKAYIEEAPSSLAEAFAGKSDISASTVEAYVAAHTEAARATSEISDAGDTAAKAGIKAIEGKAKVELAKLTGVYNLGTAEKPLIGGMIIKYTISADDEEVSVEVEREQIDRETKVGVSIPEKAALTKALSDTLNLINADMKDKSSFDKKEAEFNKNMIAIEKAINATVENKESAEAAKEARKAIKLVYKANARVPGITAEKMAMDVRLAKAVIGFAAFCVKQYK